MKTSLTIGIVILLIILGVVFLMGKNPAAPEIPETPQGAGVGSENGMLPVSGGENSTSTATTTGNTGAPKTVEVMYTASGFSPARVEIKKGDTVDFVNASPRDMWVASARHPSHTVYPDTNINKCDGASADGMFDACAGVEPEATWSFTFTETGEWGYHDHLNSSKFGTVVVK